MGIMYLGDFLYGGFVVGYWYDDVDEVVFVDF